MFSESAVLYGTHVAAQHHKMVVIRSPVENA